MTASPTTRSLLLILSGPAGSGKTTLCDRLLAEFHQTVRRLITTTTRDPRPGETDGVDYHFLSTAEFEAKIADGAFLEWALVHGRYYGSQKAHIMDILGSGKDILLNIDIQGAQAFRNEQSTNVELAGRIHTIFIKPASIDQLRERLQNRGSDDEEEIARRLHTAGDELKVADTFDHVIVSDTREADYQALRTLYLHLKEIAP